MGALIFYKKSNCGVQRIFQRHTPRRNSFYHTIYELPPRHLIHRKRSPFPSRGRHSSRQFTAKYILSRRQNIYREALKTFLRLRNPRYKPPPGGINGRRRTTSRYNITPGGINGFNAVKARRDGIERIQEVSESPARLDFAALQSFSTHAPPKKRRRTTQKPKTTSKRRRFLLFFQHPIRHLPNQRLRQLIPKLNLFWQGILCNMLFAIIHNLSLCFLSGRNAGL